MVNQRVPFVFIVVFFSLGFHACSKNAIEGDVHSFGSIGPASEVTVKAESAKETQEETADTSKEVETDNTGHFKISDLLPGRVYTIRVIDDNLISTSYRIQSPASGKLVMIEPITVVPNVGKSGIWYFPKGSSAFDTIKSASRVNHIGPFTGYRLGIDERGIKLHEGMCEPAFINSKTNVFSFSDHDVTSFGRTLPRNGILITANPDAQIERLYFINSMELPLYSAVSGKTVSIEEGWYYAIEDFYVEKRPLNERENSIRGQNSFLKNYQFLRTDSLFVIDLESLKRGTYFLTTTYYAGNKWSLFRQEPSKGYIITLK